MIAAVTRPVPTTQREIAETLANRPWHSLNQQETLQAIMLTAQGYLTQTERRPAGDGGYLLLKVGSLTNKT